MPVNGGKSTDVARPGLVQTTKGKFELCQAGALHATLNPGKWKGDRLWVVALFGEVKISDDKIGAQKREILGEILL